MLTIQDIGKRSDFQPRRYEAVFEIINERDPAVLFGCDHPSAEEHCYGLAMAQRGLGWHAARWDVAASGSTLASVLGENPYCFENIPYGMTSKQWNVELEFRRKTCQLRMEKPQNTGFLLRDHLRRGIFGEPIPKVLYEDLYNVRVLEAPAIKEPTHGLIVVSPDGFVSGRPGRAIEIKIPVQNKQFCCGCTFFRVYWSCETDCRGYHYTEGCTPYEIVQTCVAYDPCPACVEKNLTVYVHQTQGEMHVLGCDGLDFIQLRAGKFFSEVFGLKDGCDRGMSIEQMVKDFCRRPRHDRLPESKSPADYILTQYVERVPGWYESIHPKILAFHNRVMQYRTKHNITFETYVEYNQLA